MTDDRRPTAMSHLSRRRPAAVVLLAPLLGVLTLAGCGGDAESTADGAGSALAEKPAAARASEEGAGEFEAGGADSGGGVTGRGAPNGQQDRTLARVLPGDRDIVYRGAITVRVRDVAAAAARAESLTLGVDGVVFSEQTSVDPDRRGYGEATLTLRVPPTEFSATLDALGELGRELSRTRTAQDVTTQLADVDSRVRTQEASVARVRALLGRAETIGEVVRIEAELADREADLESLQAQLARLQDVTDHASIDATFIAHRSPAPVVEQDDLGFLAGLRDGWRALVEIALVALTVVGALLPFAVVAAIAGWPAYVLVRRRHRPAAAAEPAQS